MGIIYIKILRDRDGFYFLITVFYKSSKINIIFVSRNKLLSNSLTPKGVKMDMTESVFVSSGSGKK